mmetsp:Transcript_4653/g.7884  ORF Transcript_4653/g.7884 Transcript_4653/m.7884 type:complete len:223 (+) Transcript_4653:1192-1860(+)
MLGREAKELRCLVCGDEESSFAEREAHRLGDATLKVYGVVVAYRRLLASGGRAVPHEFVICAQDRRRAVECLAYGPRIADGGSDHGGIVGSMSHCHGLRAVVGHEHWLAPHDAVKEVRKVRLALLWAVDVLGPEVGIREPQLRQQQLCLPLACLLARTSLIDNVVSLWLIHASGRDITVVRHAHRQGELSVGSDLLWRLGPVVDNRCEPCTAEPADARSWVI